MPQPHRAGRLLRRCIVAALCLAVLALPGPVLAVEEAEPVGRLAFTVAAPDASGGYVRDGFAATDLGGAQQRRLTVAGDEGTTEHSPRWSPDGRWLAFTRSTPEGTQPYVVAAGGGQPRALDGNGSDPTWSPDGALLLWASNHPSPAIVVTEVAGGEWQLTLGQQHRIDLPYPVSGPRVSPDGTSVVLRMERAGDHDPSKPAPSDLWIVNLDGTRLRRLTYDVDTSAARADSHVWSPDGTQVAFLGADASSRGLPRAQIINADGTGQRMLWPTSGCEYSRAVAWAPHGDFLAVLQNCHRKGFHLVTPEGQWLGPVGAGPSRCQTPVGCGGFSFSADGTALYAVELPEADAGELYGGRLQRIPLDGSTPTVLLDAPAVALDAIDVVTQSDVDVRVVTPPPPEEPTAEPDADPRQVRSRLEYACPVQEVPYADFLDVELNSTHRLAIDCMAWWDVVSGTGEFMYGPAQHLSRAQTATMLTRLIEAAGAVLPDSTVDHFADDELSPHQANINRLAEAGLARGTGDRRFSPNLAVQRGQMASLLVTIYNYIAETPLEPAPHDHFADDGHSVHEDAINQAADAGFVAGVANRRYVPDRVERRDQAAARAARVLDAFVQQGQATPPREGLARVTRVVDGDTLLANDPKHGTVRVRLLGINTNELGTCNARPARRALRDLVLGRTVRLSSDSAASIGARLRPQRFVEVYRDGGWIDVNAELLRQGHGLWFPKAKEPRNNNAYQLLVRQAIDERLNLWDPTRCAVGPWQQARLKMWVEPNPPGPDSGNLNGEWVRIRNVGDIDVNLAGWQLRDTSSQTPYRFARDSVVAVGATMTVHVGAGEDEPLVRYWGSDAPRFRNIRRARRQAVGDGAYLLDFDGDIRAHFMYPCVGPCPDPLIDRVRISRVAPAPVDSVNWAELPNDEFVRLRNLGDTAVSLDGYQLRAAPHTYHFPEGTQIPPASTLTVRVGHGRNTAARQYWGNDSPILPDDGGMVVLRTYDRVRISCVAWGEGLCPD